jgi:hypothetical protein
MRRTAFELILLLVLVLILPTAQAATVGKIVGRVVDKESGDPLPGCNIIVTGTAVGAATNVDGYYIIINVPPGVYSVKASMMGYQQMLKTQVSVNMDKTTTVDFSLPIEAIEGETVEVIAERPLVEKDVTVKKTVISAAEIRSAPVQDLTQMFALQAGVVAIDYQSYGIPGFAERGVEQIHVRGGRSGEIGYVFDGMYIKNPTYGGKGMGTRLNKYAVEEMVTETGVFSAEYGDALSSMQNWITRTGDFEKYEGVFRYQTSEIGGSLANKPNTFFYPMYLQGLKDWAGAFGGPVPLTKNKVSFFISGESTHEKGRVLEFDNKTWTDGPIPGNSPYNPVANYLPPYNPNDPNDHSDPLDRVPGWSALGHNNTWDVFGKLAWKIRPNMKLVYTSWIVSTDMVLYDNAGESLAFRYYPEGKNYTLLNTDRQSLEWTHQISSKTFYTLRLARFYQLRRYLVKNADVDGDGSPDWVETRLNTDPHNAKSKPTDSDGDGYPDEFERNLTLMRNDIDSNELPDDASHNANIYPDPSLYPLTGEWLDSWQYNGWGSSAPYYDYFVEGSGRYFHRSYADTYEARFDLTSQVNMHHQVQFGMNGKSHNLFYDEIQLPWIATPYTEYYHKYPREFSGYLQDKIEYPYMTINLGLRLDVNNYNTTTWEDPNDPSSPLVPTKTQYKWSPRIGISHIITDRATFTFGYGIFHQLPTYRNIYQNSERDLTTWSPIVGNALVGAQKLTAYEFGVRNQIADEWVVGLVGWSKEYSELDATERVPAFPFSYTISKGIDYGTARGFDASVEKASLKTPWSARFMYTYSVAKANRADPWEGYRNTDTPETMPKREILMNYDRTHEFSVMGGYRTAKSRGFSLFGMHPLSNSMVNLIVFAESGAPYTPTIDNIPQETNSERTPWINFVTASYQKIIPIGRFQLKFGLQIDNIFDRKNVYDVYPETGKPNDPGRRANDRIAAGLNSETAYDLPFFYGPRRSIQLSTEIEF